MQRSHCSPLCIAGRAAAAAGVLIVLAVVLPKAGWWFLIGILLICGGIKLCRHK